VQCIFFNTYTYTPVYTKNFQKLHQHNTLCKIKIGVSKKNTVQYFEKKNGECKVFFYTEKKSGQKFYTVLNSEKRKQRRRADTKSFLNDRHKVR
jgi:hypothetical protein